MQTDGTLPSHRREYEDRMQAIRDTFNAHPQRANSGAIAVETRADAVDALIQSLWAESPTPGVALVAVGGYGRRELFPQSDVDLMFLLDANTPESKVKDTIRKLNQSLWDAGLRVSPMTRTLAECSRFNPENVEFTLSLLDARTITGDAMVAAQLIQIAIPKLIARDRKKCIARLLAVTRTRHTRYGDTLFHLEPNVKECPGGLRDAHVCAWLDRLMETPQPAPSPEFIEAREFLLLVRAFLHLRHGRDDNTLDWRTQDEAAAAPLGIPRKGLDASYWMRLYFRHARAIERRTTLAIDEATPRKMDIALPSLSSIRMAYSNAGKPGFDIRQSRISFTGGDSQDEDPAHDPDVVLAIFTAMSRTGASLPGVTEVRLADALPILSANLEDGPGLWRHLQAILTGPFAGRALRAMHALGILELLIPEFHGIDALVIRDAYHRYTVDEHTFVVIDTLHALTAPGSTPKVELQMPRFASLLRDLKHPGLLFLAALLHDTGKGHAGSVHALESARMAQNVLTRLELDPYEATLVLDIIRNHLEMSAALRRDVFDQETIRSFATRVPTPEALRMLTLFTYADIAAVHPDALTPWKAENLWRLHIATANFLDRNVDDERLGSVTDTELGEVMHRVRALMPNRQADIASFLEGLPRRYLQTRTPDHIRAHVAMAAFLNAPNADPNQIDFRYAPGLSEITLVTQDRPAIFATMAGALAAWGMNIVTADAFSNPQGMVVDSFRFTDTFRTLELNESERTRFVDSIRDLMAGRVSIESMLAGRRRGKKKAPKVVVESRIDFDDSASTQSTLLQVVAQDTPGLLRALSLTLAEAVCNIEVALIDTEGEMAIDVFTSRMRERSWSRRCRPRCAARCSKPSPPMHASDARHDSLRASFIASCAIGGFAAMQLRAESFPLPSPKCATINLPMNLRPTALAVLLLSPIVTATPAHSTPPAKPVPACRRAVIEGELNAGQPFSQPIGNGLKVFFQPIHSGWILRVLPAVGSTGDHDYAELATPPYQSVTPLSISTDFAFRAQDAVGWNPRRFHFATSAAAFASLRTVYLRFIQAGLRPPQPLEAELGRELAKTSEGTFTMLDARLVPGTADQWLMAASVASHFTTTAHTIVDEPPTPLGRLVWLRFRLELDLPANFAADRSLKLMPQSCSNP